MSTWQGTRSLRKYAGMTLDDPPRDAAVTLTVVGDEMEAEMLCGLLRSQGIPCSYRKTNVAGAIGAESGGFAIAGPTEVLVHQSDLEAARELLRRS